MPSCTALLVLTGMPALHFIQTKMPLFYPSASFCCKWVEAHDNNGGWGTFLKHMEDHTGYQISGMLTNLCAAHHLFTLTQKTPWACIALQFTHSEFTRQTWLTIINHLLQQILSNQNSLHLQIFSLKNKNSLQFSLVCKP
jgi:hypothetical protein